MGVEDIFDFNVSITVTGSPVQSSNFTVELPAGLEVVQSGAGQLLTGEVVGFCLNFHGVTTGRLLPTVADLIAQQVPLPSLRLPLR